MNDITPLGIGQWPSIKKEKRGVIDSNNRHLTISYEEPYIYLTGIYAYFDYPGVKGTIDVYVGDDIIFNHTFYGQSTQVERSMETVRKVFQCTTTGVDTFRCYSKPKKVFHNGGTGGSFSSSFPNMLVVNNYGQDKAIKVRLTVDYDPNYSKRRTNANLTVLNLDIPMDYYVE